jgi:hypothetical protein
VVERLLTICLSFPVSNPHLSLRVKKNHFFPLMFLGGQASAAPVGLVVFSWYEYLLTVLYLLVEGIPHSNGHYLHLAH